MFSLLQKEMPVSARELTDALEASLRRVLDVPQEAVSVRGGYPEVDEIAVNLSGASLRRNQVRPVFPAGAGEPAVTARHFRLAAHPLTFGSAAIDLELDAHDLVLHQNRGPDSNIFLLLHRAENGRVAISIPAQELETLIAEVAKSEAGKRGVVIEDVLLNLTSRGSRSLAADLRVQARKLFLRTTIRITGQLQIDDQLVAQISGLSCSGEGATGALVCGALTPHLQKLQTHRLPLMALPLGEVQLRDIRLDTADGIRVTAEFGAAIPFMKA
jgi:hypothetical protein